MKKQNFYTKPEAVKKFTEATDVDALAIAIGNAHGDYPFPPKLDLERLDEINAITDVPLVLHGAAVFRKISWQKLSLVESTSSIMVQILCIATMMQFLLIIKHMNRQAAMI